MLDALLSDAVIAYVGVPGRLDAGSPEERVVARVGDGGLAVLPRVREVVDGVYAADPPLHAFESLSEMGQAVDGWLEQRHPELSPAARRAIVDDFTYAWK